MTDVLRGVYRAVHSYTHVNYPIQDIRNITNHTVSHHAPNSNPLFQNGYPAPLNGTVHRLADTSLAHLFFQLLNLCTAYRDNLGFKTVQCHTVGIMLELI